jgi:hypothetical protein
VQDREPLAIRRFGPLSEIAFRPLSIPSRLSARREIEAVQVTGLNKLVPLQHGGRFPGLFHHASELNQVDMTMQMNVRAGRADHQLHGSGLVGKLLAGIVPVCSGTPFNTITSASASITLALLQRRSGRTSKLSLVCSSIRFNIRTVLPSCVFALTKS